MNLKIVALKFLFIVSVINLVSAVVSLPNKYDASIVRQHGEEAV